MGSQERLTLRRLKDFNPLGRLTDGQLVVLANRAERRAFKRGAKILERGVRDGLDYFLISGSVQLASHDGRHSEIQAGTDKAVNPIARLQPRMYDVKALEPCEFLVVEQETLNQLLRDAPVTQDGIASTLDEVGQSEEHQLLMEFYAELRSNQLQLPSVPDVAWKVRRLVEREETGATEVAGAVSSDPAMAAKLVRACNSPLYRGFSDVRSVQETVVRLGMRTTRQLVTVFAMREVFKSQQPALKKEMEALWQHSREVAALCWVLADHATGVNPEEAMLAGLLHDVGVVPVLVQAEKHVNLFADEKNLQHAITELRADVSCAVLENWSFPKNFIEAARYAEDWSYECREPSPQLVDIVIVAQMHAMIGSSKSSGLPAFDQVPAWRRLGELELNASRSLQVLSEARDRVNEAQKLLSGR